MQAEDIGERRQCSSLISPIPGSQVHIADK